MLSGEVSSFKLHRTQLPLEAQPLRQAPAQCTTAMSVPAHNLARAWRRGSHDAGQALPKPKTKGQERLLGTRRAAFHGR